MIFFTRIGNHALLALSPDSRVNPPDSIRYLVDRIRQLGRPKPRHHVWIAIGLATSWSASSVADNVNSAMFIMEELEKKLFLFRSLSSPFSLPVLLFYILYIWFLGRNMRMPPKYF